MRLFYAGAELRLLKSSTEWPDSEETLTDVLDAFTDVYQDSAHGTRVLDIFGTTPSSSTDESLDGIYDGLSATRLDDTLYWSLVHLIQLTPELGAHFTAYDSELDDHRSRLSPYVRHLAKIEAGRAVYGIRTKNIRNSFVYFKDPSASDPSHVRAGQIAYIFLHSRLAEGKQRIVEPFMVIDQYLELTPAHSKHDPYRRFPLLDTRLYYDQFHTRSVVVRMGDLVSHFAAFVYTPEGIGEQCIVARSLDRVRALFPSTWPLPLTFDIQS